MHPTDPGYRVHLSAEGLRRAANDNAALVKSSKLHEIVIYCAALAGVVWFVFFIVDTVARSWA